MNTKRGTKFAIKRATDPCKRYVSSNASSSAPHSQTSSEIHTRRSPILNTRCTAKAIITGARCAIVLALCNHRARHIVWEESGQVPSAKVAGASNESRWKRSGSSCVARASTTSPFQRWNVQIPRFFSFVVNTNALIETLIFSSRTSR